MKFQTFKKCDYLKKEKGRVWGKDTLVTASDSFDRPLGSLLLRLHEDLDSSVLRTCLLRGESKMLFPLPVKLEKNKICIGIQS